MVTYKETCGHHQGKHVAAALNVALQSTIYCIILKPVAVKKASEPNKSSGNSRTINDATSLGAN